MDVLGENTRVWSEEARKFFGQQFIKNVDDGTAIFAPHTFRAIETDPSLAIALQRKAQPLQDAAIAQGTRTFLNYVFS